MTREKINKIRNAVHAACKSPKNHAGYSAWTHHIVPAVEIGVNLAKDLQADQEIVELALWLHDYGSVSCGAAKQDEHHVTGATLAVELLEENDYPSGRIGQVKHCILSHRATQDIPRETLEAQIVASADAMSHFYYLDDMFYLAFVVHKLETDAAREFLLNKFANSYRKIIPEGKEIIEQKYEIIKKALTPGF